MDNLPDVEDRVQFIPRHPPRHPPRVRTYGVNLSFPGIPRTICPIPQCNFKAQTEFQRDLHYLHTHIWRLGSRYDKENERREIAYLKMGKNEDGSWFGAKNYVRSLKASCQQIKSQRTLTNGKKSMQALVSAGATSFLPGSGA